MKFLMSMIAVGLLFAGQAVAGDDPCENDSGAAYGLCNAYCEAMDCDSNDTLASDTACERVKKNYTKLTKSDAMPCDAECPFDVYFLNQNPDDIILYDCWSFPYMPGATEQCYRVEVYFNEWRYSGEAHLGPDEHVYFGPWSVYFEPMSAPATADSVYFLGKDEAQKCWSMIGESRYKIPFYPY